jgi:hypothetical protein
MELRQIELNAYLEHEEYEIGWVYVYFIDLFFFTCTYAPMVPAIVIPTLVGYFFMYWTEKYVLLNRSQRPVVNCKTLTVTAHTAMLLGPLILGFGGFLWVCVFLGDYVSIPFVAYMIQISLGVLYFITPYKSMFKCLCAVPPEEILTY